MRTHRTLHGASIAALIFGAALIGAGNAAADQVIPDDLIVQGSTCTGFDCVNNEVFNFDTLKLKENNLRIFFEDTSSSAGFPANDWRLIANDSASGGANFFAIEDSTAARQVFKVEAGAPANALFVDSTGNIGISTATPVLDLHINTSDTPAHRLEQNSAGGFTAQTWDIAGNEANFFVRDVTGGSRLPFRIRPGAPTSSLDIAANGNVGIGIAGATNKLQVAGNSLLNGTVAVGTFLANPPANTMCASPANILGTCTSDLRLKRDLHYLEGDTGLTAVMQLKPVSFRWHDGDERLMSGFIAQETQKAIPEAVHQPAGSEFLSMDNGAVLAYAVKAIQELKADNESLRAEIEKLKARRASLQ